MATESWEVRTARLEGAYEQIDRRLGGVESRLSVVDGRLSTLEQRMEAGFAQTREELRAEIHAEVGGLRSEMLSRMDRQFYWLLGVVIVSSILQLGARFSGH